MKVPVFIKEVLKQTKKKIVRPHISVVIFAFVTWYSLDNLASTSQTYKISKFQKDFAEQKKDKKEIYNEGLRLMGSAKEPGYCWAATQTMWSMAKDHASDCDVTTADIAQVSDEKLWETCK